MVKDKIGRFNDEQCTSSKMSCLDVVESKAWENGSKDLVHYSFKKNSGVGIS